MLRVNQVFRLEQHCYRILFSESHVAVWIDVHDQSALPEFCRPEELDAMILSEGLTPIEDPFLMFVLDTPEVNSRAWKIRQSGWEIIQNLIGDTAIYYPERRGALISQTMQQLQITKQTIYRHLRRYWQRGMCMNALLPDYQNSGGGGTRRQAKKMALGRPRILTAEPSLLITLDIERLFKLAIDSEYLDKENATLQDAYRLALRLVSSHATRKMKDIIPSYRQFQYFYYREYLPTEVLKRRVPAKLYDKDIRPISSTANTEVLGPGSRYQIDATIADVYLVSEHDRSLIVGRPTIYMIIDVFSRMVTGLYVGLESPSWVGAMIALGNTVEDKVKCCRELGIEITEEAWPTQGLPDAILGDRGEMLGLHVEVLIEAFKVRIENAPAYRGDAKGIVERYFNTLQANFKPYVDGVVTGDIGVKIGRADYRLDATLTLTAFRKIIMHCVLWHNRHHAIDNYDRDADMPTELPCIPLHLWQWGIANRTGRLRTYPEELVKVNLLPHKNATVSEMGIRLFGSFYTCTEALKLGWFDRAGARRPKTVLVAYDPRDANRLYLRPDGKKSMYWICELTDHSRRFKDMTFWDMWRLSNQERKTHAVAKPMGVVARSALDAMIEEIADAERNQKPDLDHLTKTERLDGIRQNREQEKQHERSNSSFMPDIAKQNRSATVTTLYPGQDDSFQYPDMVDHLFGDDENE